MTRHRICYFILLLIIIALGLATRYVTLGLPTIFNLYLGNALWGLMVFVLWGFILNNKSSWQVAAVAALFAIIVEMSQLYQAPWFDAIRNTTLGGLILGHTFDLMDIICYLAGIAVGFLSEKYRGCRAGRNNGKSYKKSEPGK